MIKRILGVGCQPQFIEGPTHLVVKLVIYGSLKTVHSVGNSLKFFTQSKVSPNWKFSGFYFCFQEVVSFNRKTFHCFIIWRGLWIMFLISLTVVLKILLNSNLHQFVLQIVWGQLRLFTCCFYHCLLLNIEWQSTVCQIFGCFFWKQVSFFPLAPNIVLLFSLYTQLEVSLEQKSSRINKQICQ